VFINGSYKKEADSFLLNVKFLDGYYLEKSRQITSTSSFVEKQHRIKAKSSRLTKQCAIGSRSILYTQSVLKCVLIKAKKIKQIWFVVHTAKKNNLHNFLTN
jgi:hypothetical protein